MKITGKTILWEGRFLKTSLKTYLGTDGNTYEWECYERTSSGVVIIVPILPDRRVMLIRQFRPPVGARVLELPAGLVDPGEDPGDTAIRELIEETGYQAEQVTRLIKGPYSPALTDGTLDIFMATGLSFVGRRGGDDNEDIETVTVDLDQAIDFVQKAAEDGENVDVKIIGLIELARRRLGAL